IRSLNNISSEQQSAIVSIGNFDGVHLGHQALLKKIVATAKAKSLPSLILTFEPHPVELFMGQNLTVPRLSNLREKFLALQDCGVDNVLVLPFTREFAAIKAADFVQDILVNALQISHLIIGDDFQFGYKREGNIALLNQLGPKMGFAVETFPTCLI